MMWQTLLECDKSSRTHVTGGKYNLFGCKIQRRSRSKTSNKKAQEQNVKCDKEQKSVLTRND